MSKQTTICQSYDCKDEEDCVGFVYMMMIGGAVLAHQDHHRIVTVLESARELVGNKRWPSPLREDCFFYVASKRVTDGSDPKRKGLCIYLFIVPRRRIEAGRHFLRRNAASLPNAHNWSQQRLQDADAESSSCSFLPPRQTVVFCHC
jgi:hypothetical protein